MSSPGPQPLGLSGCRGSGPRIFCGHVPKEVDEVAVKAHFSKWGIVTDVYFPRHKKSLKRRPFCFVSFANSKSVERALAESPLSIGGHPIKSLTAVEDRDSYYRDKHAAATSSLLHAMAGTPCVLGLMPGSGGLGPSAAAAAAAGMDPALVSALLGGLPPTSIGLGPTGASPLPGVPSAGDAQQHLLTLLAAVQAMGGPAAGMQAMGGSAAGVPVSGMGHAAATQAMPMCCVPGQLSRQQTLQANGLPGGTPGGMSPAHAHGHAQASPGVRWTPTAPGLAPGMHAGPASNPGGVPGPDALAALLGAVSLSGGDAVSGGGARGLTPYFGDQSSPSAQTAPRLSDTAMLEALLALQQPGGGPTQTSPSSLPGPSAFQPAAVSRSWSVSDSFPVPPPVFGGTQALRPPSSALSWDESAGAAAAAEMASNLSRMRVTAADISLPGFAPRVPPSLASQSSSEVDGSGISLSGRPSRHSYSVRSTSSDFRHPGSVRTSSETTAWHPAAHMQFATQALGGLEETPYMGFQAGSL